MKVKEIASVLEKAAPTALQESYDNSGLLIGDPEMEVQAALVTIDVTEEVIDEAISKQCNLIVAHHPLIFKGLKRITGSNYVERSVIKAIKNDIAIYATHTNLDNVLEGVNGKIADKLGLINRKILRPKKDLLLKLVTFVPHAQLADVQQALFEAGAGHIGEYDSCSFSQQGTGSFRANEKATPFVGEKNEIHLEPETRLEVIIPRYLLGQVVRSLKASHPYEEVAYDIFSLENSWDTVGAGMIGELEEPLEERDFLVKLKETFQVPTIRHTPLLGKKIETVALCGGSGSSFLNDALRAHADIYISGDFKYHEFFDAERQILIADIGHYESEQYTKDVISEIITKNLTNFAVRISETVTNPINYF